MLFLRKILRFGLLLNHYSFRFPWGRRLFTVGASSVLSVSHSWNQRKVFKLHRSYSRSRPSPLILSQQQSFQFLTQHMEVDSKVVSSSFQITQFALLLWSTLLNCLHVLIEWRLFPQELLYLSNTGGESLELGGVFRIRALLFGGKTQLRRRQIMTHWSVEGLQHLAVHFIYLFAYYFLPWPNML